MTSYSDNAALMDALAAGAGITVDPINNSKPANQGQNVVYTLRVTNEGSCADTFDVSVSGTDWTVTVADTVGTIGRRGQADPQTRWRRDLLEIRPRPR